MRPRLSNAIVKANPVLDRSSAAEQTLGQPIELVHPKYPRYHVHVLHISARARRKERVQWNESFANGEDFMGHLRRHLLASMLGRREQNEGSRREIGHSCNAQENCNRNSRLALYGAQISPHRHFGSQPVERRCSQGAREPSFTCPNVAHSSLDVPTRPSARRFQSTPGDELQTIVPSGQKSASLFQIFSPPRC